ncbi:MAG: hypothetical protein Q9161_007163 [Pseudevernia consocians]
MAPSATQTQTVTQTPKSLRIPIMVEAASRSIDHWIPLRLSGASKNWDQHDLTPVIGTQFENINLAEILHSTLCDETIRDIAITNAVPFASILWSLALRITNNTLPVSQRGVCVFLKQEHLTIEDQKLLARKLGELTCRPHTSGLGIHPLNQTEMPDGTIDAELTTLVRDPATKLYKSQNGFSGGAKVKKQSHIDGWHTDSSIGADLRAAHPCVRTNLVTGWKYVYAMGHHMERTDDLADVESQMIKQHLERLITENHQLQLRVKWHPEDLVIWDNRAVYHCATFDYDAKRVGNRICGVGEKPYLDSRSSGRRYAMNL